MIREDTMKRYLDALLKGDRRICRSVIEEALQTGIPANSVYIEVVWPIMVEIEKLAKDNIINSVQEHMAIRINRTIVDQLQNKLPRKAFKDKKIAICCAEDELRELGAQMMADLFESDGWDVKFLGGGLTNDDLLVFANDYSPDILLIYGTSPKHAPSVRQLIDRIREVNAWPEMKIMVSGGLFDRAEGLWQEIGADLYAPTAVEAVEVASDPVPVSDENRTINRRKRRSRSKALVEKQQSVESGVQRDV